ncbi:MAG TPA: hypothetical protein PKK00_02960 [Bacteroidales bacterium]|nr:hypothetical protein [Bacteroidales bacterium]HPS16434.1 hypothetical protein [Bacteroidales bacterium]
MKKIFLIIVGIIFFLSAANAGNSWPIYNFIQSINNNYTNSGPVDDKDFKLMYLDAQDLFNYEYYDDALMIFKRLLAQDQDNCNLNFYVGVCILKTTKQRTLAEKYLEKAVKKTDVAYSYNYKETAAPVFAFFYLGQVYHLEGKYDEALKCYEKFKTFLTNKNKDGQFLSDVESSISITINALKLSAIPIKIKIEPVKAVNSPSSELTPVLSTDGKTLYFSSKRKGAMGGQKNNLGEFLDDIYYTTLKNNTWQKPKKMGSKINSTGSDIMNSITPDGKQLLFSRQVRGTYDIFFCNLGKKNKWSTPDKLGPNINTKSNEAFAFITPDGNTMLFASDKEGGYGGYDIYMAEKTATGEWGHPFNLGPEINSDKNEICPLLLPDGTLYFSSNGHETMGGYDIFETVISEDGLWAKPENMGYPLNTASDDYNFTFTTPDGKKGMYTSAKTGGYGETDIYTFTFE